MPWNKLPISLKKALTNPSGNAIIIHVPGNGIVFGSLAQLVEHIVHIDGVTGSSPVRTTTNTKYSRIFARRAVLGVFLFPNENRREEHGRAAGRPRRGGVRCFGRESAPESRGFQGAFLARGRRNPVRLDRARGAPCAALSCRGRASGKGGHSIGGDRGSCPAVGGARGVRSARGLGGGADHHGSGCNNAGNRELAHLILLFIGVFFTLVNSDELLVRHEKFCG